MMWWPLLVASFLAAEVQAFAPAPIHWGGISAKRFVLASTVSPNAAIAQPRAVAAPHKLAIWDQELPSTMVLMELPYFMPKPDKTIAWHGTGLCIEASGGNSGDTVSVNKCTGESKQLWNILPSGQNHMNQFQLKGTNECIDVHAKEGDLNGAPVELQNCDGTSAKAWEFEAQLPLPTPSSTHRHPFLHSMRHAVFPFMGMALFGALSVTAWLWQGRTQHGAAHQNDSPSISSADVRRIPAVIMELPAGEWEERWDEGTGAPVYYNTKTGLSTSFRPASSVFEAKKQEAATVDLAGTRKQKSHFARKQKMVKDTSHPAPAMTFPEEFVVHSRGNDDPSSIGRRQAIVAAMAGLSAEAAWRKAVSVAAYAMETSDAEMLLPKRAVDLIDSGYPAVIPNFIPIEEVRELVADIKNCYKNEKFVSYTAALTGGAYNDGRYMLPSFNMKSGGRPPPPLASIEQDPSEGPFADPSVGNFELRQKFKARMAEIRVGLAKQLRERPTLANNFEHTHEIEYLYYTPGSQVIRHTDYRHIELNIPNGSRLPKKENPTRRSVTWLIYLNESWTPEDAGQMRFHARQQPSVVPVGGRGADLQVGWLQAFKDMGEQPVFLNTGVSSEPGFVNGMLYTFDGKGTRRELSRKPFVLWEPTPGEELRLRSRSMMIDDDLDASRFRVVEVPQQFVETLPNARSMVGEGVYDVPPKAGTLVLFDSVSLPHEVLQTQTERMAIQGWFHETLFSV